MAAILVLGAKVPFVRGGQEVLVQTLVQELRRRGHTADTIELPLQMLPKEGLLNHCAWWRSLDLRRFGDKPVDLVIATKFPTYYARHDCKSIWLVHQHRAMYDLYGTRYSDFSDDPRDEALRRMLMEGDRQVIGEAAYVSGISSNVTRRLAAFNGISAEVLYPPLPLAGRYRSAAPENYILSVGRLCAIKRVDMMIKALPLIDNSIQLKIVGSPDEPGIMEYYHNEINKHHLWERVEFLGRVDDETLLDLYARAFAVYYAPHDEDYGYVTLEAMASGKPVITAFDSGGVLEFVRHLETGLVVQPASEPLGHAITWLLGNRAKAEAMGLSGKKFVEQSGLGETGWDQVVAGLLSPLNKPTVEFA